ncbi:hypothetical protein LTR09_002209 [Extremus antarcticus]|uniref:Uncharacterized protein n=1 Tax=Extremus antarcticus TaxID=702011 RepID=A0AAJ0GGN8_9PEZI|nr:hypothetical protein LTR09_002209 [Extremus antarcticus]
MDADDPGNGSPWRIKVTVEAEPKDGSSPAKRVTRTTKVPLKGGNSSSPAKRSASKKAIADDETEREIRRPQRKRKGTPIRRSATRSQDVDSEPVDEWTQPAGQIEMSQKLQEEMSSPNKRRSSGGQSYQAVVPARERVQRSRANRDHQIEVQQQLSSEKSDYEVEEHLVHDNLQSDMTVANEDFTMVSVDTLQSMKPNTSLVDTSGIDKSAASVSYMPSSPPQARSHAAAYQPNSVRYPNIEGQAKAAKLSRDVSDDSRHESGTRESSNRAARQSHPTPVSNDRFNEEPSEWQRERQAVNREIEGASTGQVIVIDDETEAGAEYSRESSDIEEEGGIDVNPDDDLDIWAEEASRSLDDDIEPSHRMPANRPESRPPQLEDLFSDQALKPPRPKIPRTWRRTSGAGFAYSDSPAHEVVESRKPSATDTGGEGAGSRSSAGVLTPPESSDSDFDQQHEVDEDVVDYDISLTQPDAAATQLHNEHREPEDRGMQVTRKEANSPLPGLSISPGGDDTGVFWQSNLPKVFRNPARTRVAQKQKAMDLSELLNLDKTETPAASSTPKKAIDAPNGKHGAGDQVRHQLRGVVDHHGSSTAHDSQDNIVSGRRNLLRSSKVGDDTQTSSDSQTTKEKRVPRKYVSRRERNISAKTEITIGHSSTQDSTVDSFSSKASDQRQILQEMSRAPANTRASHLRKQRQGEDAEKDGGDVGAQSHISEIAGDDYQGSSVHSDTGLEASIPEEEQPSRSYEEHLNIESPQKIRVKFNDSISSSGLLAPKRTYPPLFDNRSASSNATKQAGSRPSTTVVSKTPTAPTELGQPGILARLSSTIWSAVPAEPVYSASLRARIRSRYGVLSDQHPWTMAHMRTLHRLLNSCTSNKSDSIVPRTGPLPYALESLVGKNLRCVTEFRWVFTEQHAHVVDAFMQVLVPAHYIESMRCGEVDFIGDSEAKKYRGLIQGRHGDDLVFSDFFGLMSPKGTIGRDFVVKALGNCVCANIITAEKEAAEAAALKPLCP